MNELNMIRVLLGEAPPSAEVIAEGRRRITASAAEPARPVALDSQGFRYRTARRVAVGVVAAGAAAALAFVTLVPHGAPAAHPSHSQAGGLVGQPAREFLLTMAVKAAAASPSTGRWYCTQMQEGGRDLVGANDTTLQGPWDQGPPASLAGYQYAIFTKHMMESCYEPPTKGAPYGTVEGVTQSLGAQPASPADEAAWRRAGSPTSWIAWYDKTARITMAPGPQYHAGPRNLTASDANDATPPASPAQLRAFILAQAHVDNGRADNQILFNDALIFMRVKYAPAVRAAAYRLLASLPGVRMKPSMQDPAGQSGTAVWLPSQESGPGLGLAIIDPTTATVLCFETVVRHPVAAAHVTVGTVLSYTLIVSSGWTNTPPGS